MSTWTCSRRRAGLVALVAALVAGVWAATAAQQLAEAAVSGQGADADGTGSADGNLRQPAGDGWQQRLDELGGGSRLGVFDDADIGGGETRRRLLAREQAQVDADRTEAVGDPQPKAAGQAERADDPAEAPTDDPAEDLAEAPGASAVADETWEALANCESGYGDGPTWDINTGNGFYGGLQFEKRSWDWAGGQQFAEYPHQATRAQQITVAEQLLEIHPAGWGAWPACADKLGLR